MKKSSATYNTEPYDDTNSENPWLINHHLGELVVDPISNEPLTAEYIWQHKGFERNHLVKRVFNYYKSKTFEDIISPKLSNRELKASFEKLKKTNEFSCVNGKNEIKNSSSVSTEILKHFCGGLFYSARGRGKKSASCRDVFEDDEKFLAVLRNRMGYRVSREDGQERPYVFAISDKMIVQGMRSSGLAYTVSTFKPAVAKFVYSKWAKAHPTNRVFDPSCGWGARAIGAGALGLEYWGIDPLTSNNVQEMMNFYGIPGQTLNGGSEFKETYKPLIEAGLTNQFGFAFSSPPYFDLEIYSKDANQSTERHSTYEQWLENFWRLTVRNIKELVLTKDGLLGVATLEKVNKHNLSEDMVKICSEEGFFQKDFMPFSTSKSHLSGKRKTKQFTKTTEGIYIFSL